MNTLKNIFVTNWMTTSAGLLALALGVATYFGVSPDPKLTALATSVLTAFLGMSAQDTSITGVSD